MEILPLLQALVEFVDESSMTGNDDASIFVVFNLLVPLAANTAILFVTAFWGLSKVTAPSVEAGVLSVFGL